MTEDKKKKIVKWYWILLVTPFVALFLLLCLVWAFADIPSLEQLENPDTKLATQVIAEEGEILTTYHIENRTFVGYDELALIHAHETPLLETGQHRSLVLSFQLLQKPLPKPNSRIICRQGTHRLACRHHRPWRRGARCRPCARCNRLRLDPLQLYDIAEDTAPADLRK